MPFVELNVKETIEREKNNSPEFAKAWDDSRTEKSNSTAIPRLSMQEQKAIPSPLS